MCLSKTCFKNNFKSPANHLFPSSMEFYVKAQTRPVRHTLGKNNFSNPQLCNIFLLTEVFIIVLHPERIALPSIEEKVRARQITKFTEIDFHCCVHQSCSYIKVFSLMNSQLSSFSSFSLPRSKQGKFKFTNPWIYLMGLKKKEKKKSYFYQQLHLNSSWKIWSSFFPFYLVLNRMPFAYFILNIV